ncbi:MAG: hypothetical protein KAS57_04505 [Gammaproteobacteria bacterium]|nr:hypothetical protein [Gammaproteobacteria bacterium]
MSKFVFLFPVILLLASCSVIDDKPADSKSILETRAMNAWRLSSSEQRIIASNRAVGMLLKQADDLMAEADFARSSDKLERLVRIEPRFAQAWSRLAWIALENGEAQRSHQLAQRSNSYSHDNDKLKLLNWRLIHQSGELLHNAEMTQQAEQMIKNLGDE